MMMLMFVDEFQSFPVFTMKFDEGEEKKEENEVFYEFLGLVPLRILFFDFGPSNFVTQHMEQHISVVCHVTCRHTILRLPHRRFCNK